MKVYYHRNWAESNKGGASMLISEEYVYSAEDLSDVRELQDESQPEDSGWDCHRFLLEWEGNPADFRPEDIEGFDGGLPFVPATRRDRFAWEIERTSVGEVIAAEVLAMTAPSDWGCDDESEWWVEFSPSVPGELEENPALVFCRLSYEAGAVTNRDYRHIALIYPRSNH